jgi:UDP-N-acetylglucosamine:LPS N-acetylglucosamine transferase
MKISQSWQHHSVVYVSTLAVVRDSIERLGPVHIIGECNRQHPFKALAVLLRSVRVVWKERPDVVLTTGSLPLAMVALVAKLFGAKIIWIDSITNVERLSMSGRLVRPFADVCLTQWAHLEPKYKNVQYAGAVV